MKHLIWAVLLAGAAVGAMEFRIEAEEITERGDWKIGGQGELSVSRALIISCKGTPAGKENVITGTYPCPEAGKYYVWVRSENHGERYRKTEVKINGKSIGKYGDEGVKGQKPALAWKRSLGPVTLPAGEFKLELIPLSMYSRIDSLIFTTDQNYKPSDDPREVEQIEALECE